MRKPAATGNPAIATVMADIAERAPLSLKDPKAPVYHFRPETGWMNDVNGLLHHDGIYHAFYQLHPYSPGFGRMHWGHARSADLIHWERLPVGIWPSLEMNEKGCWSGCATTDGSGRPIMFYTAVFNDKEEGWKTPFQQWAVRPADRELIAWEKHPGNPVLDYATHAQPSFDATWRDPFVFEHESRRFLTLSTGRAGYPLPLYEAQNAELTRWKYLGTIYDRNAECPNFFRLGDRWVFFTSAYKNGTEYSTGTFDLAALAYTPSVKGFLDTGYQSAGNKSLYGTNVLFDSGGRCLLFGRLNGFDGFSAANGWNGCMALPRSLSLDSAGRIIQQPVAEALSLRRVRRHAEPASVDDGTRRIAAALPNTLEILLRIDMSSARSCGVNIYCCSDPARPLVIGYSGRRLRILDNEYELQFCGNARPLEARIFLDKSVVEVFLNGGLETLSAVFDPGLKCESVELFASGGRADFGAVDVWEIGGIWA